RSIARDPRSDASLGWLRDAKEQIQCLAACIELDDALKAWPRAMTQLPCTIDASASGFQHLSLMRAAPAEAALVNLIPGMAPQSLYQKVWDAFRLNLDAVHVPATPHTPDPYSDDWIYRTLRGQRIFSDWVLSHFGPDDDEIAKPATMQA